MNLYSLVYAIYVYVEKESYYENDFISSKVNPKDLKSYIYNRVLYKFQTTLKILDPKNKHTASTKKEAVKKLKKELYSLSVKGFDGCNLVLKLASASIITSLLKEHEDLFQKIEEKCSE